MKGWYQESNNRAPPLSWIDIERITVEQVTIYQRVLPRVEYPCENGTFCGGLIGTIVGGYRVVCEAALLKPLWGPSGMQMEQLQCWVVDVIYTDMYDSINCLKVVDLVQT